MKVERFVRIVGPSCGITDKDAKKNKQAKFWGDRKSHHATGTTTFIGIDGEGINLPNGEHRYVMLSIGSDPKWTIVDENGLEWTTILDHLYSYHLANERRNVAYVGFFLGYDFDRWLRTMPQERVTRLITTEGRKARKKVMPNGRERTYPVDLPYGWQVKMLGKKRFELRKRNCNCDKTYCGHEKGPWMYICDTGSFFQCSFLKAIDPKNWREPIVSDKEYEIIKAGKDKRADATKPTEEMAVYNRLENEVLARLMATLNNGFREMGINLAPGQWFGPGQSAQTWMKNNGIPQGEEITKTVPTDMLIAAKESYFGGWFEIMMHGIIPGESHEYDINSAYPYIISRLPCLLHGEYKRGNGKPTKDTGYVLVYASVSSYKKGYTRLIGTMLHRESHDTILRPDRTEGWYWLHEINAAKRAGLILHCHIYKWISYDPCNCQPPLQNVTSLYDLRLKAGKDTPLGKSAKLTYNSKYGKFAQSIGHPIFANSIYASLITAGCRTMILDAIATHPQTSEDVCMVATDAVYFVTPHPSLPLSNKLGDWEHKIHSNLTLFKPGVYWNDETIENLKAERELHFKSRGAPAAAFGVTIPYSHMIFSAWHQEVNYGKSKGIRPAQPNEDGIIDGWPIVDFKVPFSMTSCLQAIRRNKWEMAGEVEQDVTIQANSNPYKKRNGIAPSLLKDGRLVFRSHPHSISINERKSKPYEKQFGMEDPWSEESIGRFDTHPDGPIDMLIQEKMGLK
jgi:hypothetical protein